MKKTKTVKIISGEEAKILQEQFDKDWEEAEPYEFAKNEEVNFPDSKQPYIPRYIPTGVDLDGNIIMQDYGTNQKELRGKPFVLKFQPTKKEALEIAKKNLKYGTAFTNLKNEK